jgi:hypothetical protein
VTLRKQKNKEMKRPAGSVLTGCRRDCPVEEGAWICSLAGSKASDTRSGSMPANSAPVCSIRADGTEVTEWNYNGVP